jgi:hypothetical protein
MQLANFAYRPGMYEILGPPDCDLPRCAHVQEGYTSPSILGFKIRATYHPWLSRNPTVTAYLHEGMIVWLDPKHRVPFMLSTGETRIWICFGTYEDEQHWGWITSDPYAAEHGKSHPWIKKMSDSMEYYTEHLPREYHMVGILHGASALHRQQEYYMVGHSDSSSSPNNAAAEHASVIKSAPTSSQHSKDEEAPGDDDDVRAGTGETDHSIDAAGETGAAGLEEAKPGDTERSKEVTVNDAVISVRQMNLGDSSENKDDIAQRNRTVTAHKKSRSREMRRIQATKIAELVRINAMNLEPSLPRKEMTPKEMTRAHQMAMIPNETFGGDRKKEFQHSLDIINRRHADKERQRLNMQQQQQQGDQEPESSSCASCIEPNSELYKQAQELQLQNTQQQQRSSAQASGSSRGSSSHQAHEGTSRNRKGLYAWQ